MCGNTKTEELSRDKLEYFDIEIDDKGKFIVRKHITEHVKMCINSMT